MDIWWQDIFSKVYICSCNYLIGSVLVTLISVVFILVYDKTEKIKDVLRKLRLMKQMDRGDNNDISGDGASLDEGIGESSEITGKTLLPGTRQHAINELNATLTKEQLEEEKEIEKVQLQAIFNLLKEQQDKFQVSSMEQLEEQLSLYR